ncbi:hypothetical protein FHX06_000150 [Rhizobium sp. BK512]|nr:hypothetical protein [Rhizobium sp. BK512]
MKKTAVEPTKAASTVNSHMTSENRRPMGNASDRRLQT